MNELLYPLGKTLVLPWSSSISTEKDTDSIGVKEVPGILGQGSRNTHKKDGVLFSTYW